MKKNIIRILLVTGIKTLVVGINICLPNYNSGDEDLPRLVSVYSAV